MPDHSIPRIPPSIHEDVFQVSPAYEADPEITSTRAALKRAREAAEKAREIAQARLADETKTEAARHLLARDDIYRTTRPAVEHLQDVTDRLDGIIRKLRDITAGPPAPANAVTQMQAMEIRSALAAMNRQERRKTVMRSLDNPQMAASVLRGPAFLAGVSDEEQADYRQQWAQRMHPQEVERLAVLEKASEALQRAGSLLVNYQAALVDNRLIQRAEQLAARAEQVAAGSSASVH